MFPPQLVHLLLALVAAGVLLWGVSAWPNLDPTIKQMVRILVIVFASIYAIYALAEWLGYGFPVRR